jgi:hypothetical protein
MSAERLLGLLTRPAVEQVVARVCADLGCAPPKVSWTERTRNGRYRPGAIVVGPRLWRGWDAVIHELAHHVDRLLGVSDMVVSGPSGVSYLRRDWHGQQFRESLELVATIAYGDAKHYGWQTEYKAIQAWWERAQK